MADPLVSNQGINIGGHKVPFPLIMAGAAVVTIFLIMKSRSGGTVAIGAQPTTDPNAPSYGAQLALGSPQEAQLANLGQQLATIQQTIAPVVNPIPAGTQGNFSLDLSPQSSADPTIKTHISQTGSAIEAFHVNDALAAEWGTTYFTQKADPLAVYTFIQDLYHQEGLGIPPTSGTFRAGTPSGPQIFPFYAPGMGPGIVTK